MADRPVQGCPAALLTNSFNVDCSKVLILLIGKRKACFREYAFQRMFHMDIKCFSISLKVYFTSGKDHINVQFLKPKSSTNLR